MRLASREARVAIPERRVMLKIHLNQSIEGRMGNADSHVPEFRPGALLGKMAVKVHVGPDGDRDMALAVDPNRRRPLLGIACDDRKPSRRSRIPRDARRRSSVATAFDALLGLYPVCRFMLSRRLKETYR